jgi:hypothetical protein
MLPLATPTPLPVENVSTGKGPINVGISGDTLPCGLRHDGFDLRQVERVGRVAIYEKTKDTYKGWEIILIRKRPGRQLPGGKHTPAREQYPSSAEWGIRGWTAMSLTNAKRQFNKLVRRHEKSI